MLKRDGNLKIDTVLLTKNSVQPCLNDCLNSLKNNIPINKLIVVDGGSTDRTIELIEEYNEYFPVEVLIDKGGRAKSREIGIRAVQTEWFLFVDSDVILCENWFVKAKKYIDDNVGAIWGAALQRSPTDAARYKAMSRLYGKDELWIAVKAGRRRGLTHDTLIRTEAVKGIIMPAWLHVLEDQFTRQHIESKGYRWLSVPDPYCYHFAQGQDRPRDYYLFGWCGKKIGFLRKRDILMYLIWGIPKSLWIYVSSGSIQAMKTQYNVYFLTIKGWLNG